MEKWVHESTSPYPTNPDGNIAWRAGTWFTHWKDPGASGSRSGSGSGTGYYKYLWWGKLYPDGTYDYMTHGHLGQWIYVSPQNGTVIVRFGTSDQGVDAWEDVIRSVAASITEKVK